MTRLEHLGVGDARVGHVRVDARGAVEAGPRARAAADRLVVAEARVAEGHVVHRALARGGEAERAEQHVDDALRGLDVAADHRRARAADRAASRAARDLDRREAAAVERNALGDQTAQHVEHGRAHHRARRVQVARRRAAPVPAKSIAHALAVDRRARRTPACRRPGGPRSGARRPAASRSRAAPCRRPRAWSSRHGRARRAARPAPRASASSRRTPARLAATIASRSARLSSGARAGIARRREQRAHARLVEASRRARRARGAISTPSSSSVRESAGIEPGRDAADVGVVAAARDEEGRRARRAGEDRRHHGHVGQVRAARERIVGDDDVARREIGEALAHRRAPSRPSRRGAPGCAARWRPARRRASKTAQE